jgi:ABC-type multidrug transport system ATPase subunit
MTALLTLRDVAVRRDGRTVLDGVSLQLHEGEVTAVMGPNGAGKSTLLAAIGGELPVAGTLERHGRVATVLQDAAMASRSVRANVDLAQAWWGVPRPQRRARTQAALRDLNVAHLARRPAAQLSGGERRRVHLARGVALGADVLLLDEPFAGLDPDNRAALVDDASSVLRTAARATVLVLHDRADVWALADRLLIVMAGRLAADGRPDDLLAKPPSVEVARFLGYDGELATDGEVLLTRPAHVVLDEDGDLEATVTRVLRAEDGNRLELTTARGRLRAFDATGGVAAGQVVRVRLAGGVRFPG